MPRFFHPYHGSIGKFFEGDPTLDVYFQFANKLDNTGQNKNLSGGTSALLNLHRFLDKEGVSAYADGTSGSVMSFWSETKQWGDITIFLWFKTPNPGNSLLVAVTNVVGNNNYFYFNVDPDPNRRINFGAVFGGTWYGITSQVSADNRWHLLTQVRRGGTHYAYVDGLLYASTSIPTTLTDATTAYVW